MARYEYSTNGYLRVIVDTAGGIADIFIEEPMTGLSRAAWSTGALIRLVHDITNAVRYMQAHNSKGAA